MILAILWLTKHYLFTWAGHGYHKFCLPKKECMVCNDTGAENKDIRHGRQQHLNKFYDETWSVFVIVLVWFIHMVENGTPQFSCVCVCVEL